MGFTIAIGKQISGMAMTLPEQTHRLPDAGRYGDQSLAIAFADDRQIPRGFVDIGNFNPDRLPQTQTAGIHYLQAAAIDRMIDGMDQLQAVVMIQDAGQPQLR